jgi:hypothetical protein
MITVRTRISLKVRAAEEVRDEAEAERELKLRCRKGAVHPQMMGSTFAMPSTVRDAQTPM